MLGNASNDERLFVGCSFLRSVLVIAMDSVLDVQASQLFHRKLPRASARPARDGWTGRDEDLRLYLTPSARLEKKEPKKRVELRVLNI